MTQLDVQAPGVAGELTDYQAATAAGDKFKNNGRVLLIVKNGGASPITVTIDDPNSSSPPSAKQFNADVDITVANGAEKVIGPFPPARFNDDSGDVTLTYSDDTSVTVAVLQAGS